MKMTTLENLLRMSEGDFDYNKIYSESLSNLALQESDPVAATSALGELTQRDSDDARITAQAILQKNPWDAHLTAYALTVLYSRDAEAGLHAMEQVLNAATEKTIIEALIENVLSDEKNFRDGAGVSFVSRLAKHLRERPDLSVDAVFRFRAAFEP